MMELNPHLYDAELFFGSEVRTISERLTEAGDYPSMILIVEEFLLAQCRRLQETNTVDAIAIHL